MAMGNVGTAGRWKGCKVDKNLIVTGQNADDGGDVNFKLGKEMVKSVNKLFVDENGAQVEVTTHKGYKGIFELSPDVYKALNNAMF